MVVWGGLGLHAKTLGKIRNFHGGLWIFKKIIDTIAKIATVYGLALIMELIFSAEVVCRFISIKQVQK